MKKILSLNFYLLLLCSLMLGGCSAAHTMIKKRNLDVQTKMSETIFLEPVSPSKKIIYIDFRNTSDKELMCEEQIRNNILTNGYRITNDPAEANFMLQVNILQAGKSDMRSANSALLSGFGGAVTGVAIAGMTNSSGQGMIGAGLLGAAIGVIGNALVDDVIITMITDLQIRERPLKGETISQSQATDATQGTATRLKQNVSGGNITWKTYRTRIVSTANKVNLKFSKAQPALADGLIRSISGVF